MCEYLYWITLVCMVVYYLSSISQTFCYVRKAKNVRTIRNCSSSILLDTMRFATFFFLYFYEGFGAIYNHLYYGLDLLFIYAELIFVVIVVSLYFAPELLYHMINGFANKHSRKRILINMKNTVYSVVGVVILVIMYLILLYADKLIWGMLPFGFALLVVAVDAISGPVRDMKLITPKALIWLAVQGVVIIGMGLLVFEIAHNPVLSNVMGVRNNSIAANLLGILILALPLIDVLAYLEKKFRPHLVIEMKQEMIIDD